ncbi:MAG: DUF5660 family protein [Patescibacteria group bacterium]|nr:DUF5660 family protein [Patescibacteria group bacterium]
MTMTPALSDTNKKKKNLPKSDNFIEAFKDSRPASKAITGKFDFESFLSQQEARIRQNERQRFDQIRHEEQIVFSRQNQETKLEIETLQVEIKKLAKEVGGVMIEAEKTSFQAVINPGVYHKNFFKRLLSLIQIAKKTVIEGKTWLQMANHRSQSRSAYWTGVKKGGTSYMLSSDRTVATQAG